MAVLAGADERGIATIVTKLQLGSELDESSRDLVASVARRQVERSGVMPGACVHVRAVCRQESNHVHTVGLGGMVKRSPAGLGLAGKGQRRVCPLAY
jgi:hypothetical protein